MGKCRNHGLQILDPEPRLIIFFGEKNPRKAQLK